MRIDQILCFCVNGVQGHICWRWDQNVLWKPPFRRVKCLPQSIQDAESEMKLITSQISIITSMIDGSHCCSIILMLLPKINSTNSNYPSQVIGKSR